MIVSVADTSNYVASYFFWVGLKPESRQPEVLFSMSHLEISKSSMLKIPESTQNRPSMITGATVVEISFLILDLLQWSLSIGRQHGIERRANEYQVWMKVRQRCLDAKNIIKVPWTQNKFAKWSYFLRTAKFCRWFTVNLIEHYAIRWWLSQTLGFIFFKTDWHINPEERVQSRTLPDLTQYHMIHAACPGSMVLGFGLPLPHVKVRMLMRICFGEIFWIGRFGEVLLFLGSCWLSFTVKSIPRRKSQQLGVCPCFFYTSITPFSWG